MTRKQSLRKRVARLARYFLPAVLLLILTSITWPSFSSWSLAPGKVKVTGQDDTAAIEAKYGIHVKRLAVIAGGGAVEFRFLIADPEAANAFMHDSEYMPVMIAEDSGAQIDAPEGSHHSMVYKFGTGYHILYGNPGGVIKSGTPVTLVFGELQQHIVAQ